MDPLTRETVTNYERMAFSDLPQNTRGLMLRERIEEEQVIRSSGEIVEGDLLRKLEESGYLVCGARWSDGTVGVVIWPKEDGPDPDVFALWPAYAVAHRRRQAENRGLQ